MGFSRWVLFHDDVLDDMVVESGELRGRTVVAKLRGIDDRDQARALVGAEITVPRTDLPPCDAGEYYWADLEGLRVCTLAGEELGLIDGLFSTGAHDIIVVEGERQRLIPFVLERVVQKVDLDGGLVVVDWDSDY